jgi:hypothetical protein
MTDIAIDTTTVVADGIALITVSDIPVGGLAVLCRVGTEGIQVELEKYPNIDDGVLELSFDTAGDYFLRVTGKEIIESVSKQITEEVDGELVVRDITGTNVPSRSTLEAHINAS